MAKLFQKIYLIKKISQTFLYFSQGSRSMEKLFVRAVKGEERLQISLEYEFDTGRKRVFNMDRCQTENNSMALARLANNITSISKKKSKKKKGKEESDVEKEEEEQLRAELYVGNNLIQPEVTNIEAWLTAAELRLGDKRYEILVNPPTVKKLELAGSILAGFPTSPRADMEFCNLSSCNYTWFKALAVENPQKGNKTKLSDSELPWEQIEKGLVYMPVNADIGYHLKVICEPSDGKVTGLAVEAVSRNAVSASPGYCPFEKRHDFTPHVLPDSCIRALSYNILADFYADSDFSRQYLFPYCPPYALDIEYRKQLILKELIGYNADVMCLQEVDRKVFLYDLQPVLSYYGLEGLLCQKSEQTPEGTATLYRTSKFRLIDQHNVPLSKALQEMVSLSDVWAKVCGNELMKTKMEERTSTLQVTALERLANVQQVLLVATTHLYFHPKASNVRLIQVYSCMKHLESVCQLYKTQGKTVAVLFCGDLNSLPLSGAVKLLNDGEIQADSSDWFSGGQEEFIPDMNLSHTLRLNNAGGYPEYTNYVTSFYGCLDYIYTDRDMLTVKHVVPQPSHQEVTQFIALPNPIFPSDHLAVICDLQWNC